MENELVKKFLRDLVDEVEGKKTVSHTIINQSLERPYTDLPLDYQVLIEWMEMNKRVPRIGFPIIAHWHIPNLTGISMTRFKHYYNWYENPEYWKPETTPQLPFYYRNYDAKGIKGRWFRRDQVHMIVKFRKWLKRGVFDIKIDDPEKEEKIKRLNRLGIY